MELNTFCFNGGISLYLLNMNFTGIETQVDILLPFTLAGSNLYCLTAFVVSWGVLLNPIDKELSY